MKEININIIEKGADGDLVVKYPTTTEKQVKGLKESLDKKVDKVEGKQLSTNDYSTEDKNKLAELENYDDTNIKADIAKKADTSTVNTNLAKKVDKVSGKGLSTNDYTDLEKSEVAKIKNLATSETVTGIKSDVENLKTSKVNTEVGKGLSANDYTTAEKNKLSGIQAGAQVNAVTSVAGRTGEVTITKSDVGLGNVDNIKQMPISGGILENYREKLVTVAASGSVINLSLGNVFQHTPSLARTYSIISAVTGQAHSFTLIINTGSTVYPLNFPASVKWQGGEIPDLTTASKTYVLTFMTVDGGTTWLGMFGGEF